MDPNNISNMATTTIHSPAVLHDKPAPLIHQSSVEAPLNMGQPVNIGPQQPIPGGPPTMVSDQRTGQPDHLGGPPVGPVYYISSAVGEFTVFYSFLGITLADHQLMNIYL